MEETNLKAIEHLHEVDKVVVLIHVRILVNLTTILEFM